MIDYELRDVVRQREQAYDDEIINVTKRNIESLCHKEQCYQSRIVGKTAA